MNRFIGIALVVFLAALNSGCATLADAQSAKGTGSVKVYDQPYDVVWNAVVETVNASSLDIVTVNKNEGSILAQGAISAFSWGENVAIFVESVEGKVQTRVEVVNKRAVPVNVTASDWEAGIFESLDKRL